MNRPSTRGARHTYWAAEFRSAKRSCEAFACLLWFSAFAHAQALLDETWADGSRAESNLPKEAAVWAGRKADVTVSPGSLSTVMTPTSQKLWLYFSDKPVKLEIGQKLTASVSFVPRGTLSTGTSRSFRIGLFHDPTSPRVEEDLNSDGGGDDAPWADAAGYAVQILVAGGEYATAKPFDLGKRTNMKSQSLLGTSGDYTKVSGGEPVVLEADKEYTVTLEVAKIADKQVDVTATYSLGSEELSTWAITDDGDYLGTEPLSDTFDLLFIRIANKETTADKLDFTHIKVELAKAEATN